MEISGRGDGENTGAGAGVGVTGAGVNRTGAGEGDCRKRVEEGIFCKGCGVITGDGLKAGDAD